MFHAGLGLAIVEGASAAGFASAAATLKCAGFGGRERALAAQTSQRC
jgi:hypothetical protein